MTTYIVNTPSTFQNNGEVKINLINTLSLTDWNLKVGLDDKITIGTSSVSDVLVLDDTSGGSARSQTFRLKRGINKVDLTTDSGLSQDYTFNFPAMAPTGDGQMITSSASTNVFYDIHAKNVLTVRKNPGPAEYGSVIDAINAISSMPIPTDTNRYVIYINTGSYSEPHFTVPQYTFLVGISMEGVVLVMNDVGNPYITLGNRTGLAFMTIRNTDPNYPAVNVYNCGDYALLHKIEFEGCVKCVRCITDALATESSFLYLEYMGTTDSFNYAVKSEDSNLLGGYGSNVSIENFFIDGHADDGLLIDGLNSQIFAQATVMQGDGTGNSVRMLNGGEFSARGLYVEFFDTAINVENSVYTPFVLISGILFEACNKNIWIQNPTTTGHYDGYTEYTKTIIPTASPFFVANKDPNIITVSKKGSDFTSVYDALQAITGSGPLNRYTIYVGPGYYSEPQLVLKPYVFLTGFFQTQTILESSDLTKPFVIGARYSAVSNLTLKGTNVISPGVYSPALAQYMGDITGEHFRIDDVTFISGQKLIDVGSTNGPCIFLLNSSSIDMSSPFISGVNIDDTGPNHYPILFLLNNVIWAPDLTGRSLLSKFITITSTKSPSATQNIVGAITGCQFGTAEPPHIGECVEINGSCLLSMQSTIMGGYQTCISCPNNAEISLLLIESITCTNNTIDVDIQNPNAQGTLSGGMTISKVVIASNSFGVTLNDPDGSIALTGSIYQGRNYSTITNITEEIQRGSTLGIIGDIPTFTYTNPTLNITVSPGNGYLMLGGIDLKYTNWGSATITLPDNTLSWIYVDNTGTITSATSEPDIIATIILGTTKTYSGSITYIQRIGSLINNMPTQLDRTNSDIFGPIVKSGCIGAPGSSLISRAVAISSGEYALSTKTYLPSSADNITMTAYHGSTIETIITNVPLFYDASGTLTAIGVGKWVKHSIYLLTDPPGSSTTTYFFVYGQIQFDSELDAQTGDIPTPPPTFVGNMCPFTAVIVTDTDGNSPLPSSRFRDIRPRIGFVASGVTASANHNSLLNLPVGDAHPQYFRTDGTRVMAGDVQLGTNNITGVGGNLLNGVDITNHASRHLPGGADALATGVPVTISTANSMGSASSFSRSDHIHSHGSLSGGTLHSVATTILDGFMSTSDKTKLDNATINDVPSTIMMRGSSGETYLSQLNLLSSNSSYYTSILTSPTGFGGPNHNIFVPVPATDDTVTLLTTTQSLTNKTITDPSNVVTASRLRTTGADVVVSSSIPPTTGQVLTATNATTAVWSTPTAGSVTSVNLTAPAEFNVSGVPITISGTIAITKNTQSVNTVYAGPASGGPAVPTFRTLTSTDLTNSPTIFQILSSQVTVNNGSSSIAAYIAWQNSSFGFYTTRTIVAYVVPSTAAGKNLTITIIDPSNTSLGSILIPGLSSAGIYSFTFTNPGADTYLRIQTSRTGSAGQSPTINGVFMKLI
jgi:hypothetical protein